MISPCGLTVCVRATRKLGRSRIDRHGALEERDLSESECEENSQTSRLIMETGHRIVFSPADVKSFSRGGIDSSEHGGMLLERDGEGAVLGEEMLCRADGDGVKRLVIPLEETDSSTALSDFISVLSTFQPHCLSEVTLLAADDTRRLYLEDLCKEQFQTIIQQHCVELGTPTRALKEDGVPLLNIPRFHDNITSTNETQAVMISDYVLSGFRRVAQMVFDTLISVKTEDEDDQPYGEVG